jgi:hypothetical protein
MAVRCIAHQLHVYLLSPPLSSLAKQAVKEEPFTSPIQAAAIVFYTVYVVMIVAQRVVHTISLRV